MGVLLSIHLTRRAPRDSIHVVTAKRLFHQAEKGILDLTGPRSIRTYQHALPDADPLPDHWTNCEFDDEVYRWRSLRLFIKADIAPEGMPTLPETIKASPQN